MALLISGCGNRQAGNSTKQPVAEMAVEDELYKNAQKDVEFVAVKMPPTESTRKYVNPEDGTYYEYYIVGEATSDSWKNPEYINLPCELKIGEFAYLKADASFVEGGYSGVSQVEFGEIRECKKISLKEAADFIKITDLYECEKGYLDGFGGLARHSEANDYLMIGQLQNRYEYPENKENSFYGDVKVYCEAQLIAQYNRLDFVGDYLVFFSGEEDGRKEELPEYITVEAVEQLLATGMQHNDDMLVLHRREK